MLGNNIKKIRIDKNIGVNELGRMIGTSGSYISALESGKRENPSIDILNKIADVLEVNINELLTTEAQLEITTDALNKINELARKAFDKDMNFEETLYAITGKFQNEKFDKADLKEIENYIKFVLYKKKEEK